MKNKENISSADFANLALDMGTYLLASGAHCGRVYNNLSRIAKAWGFELQIDPSFKGLLVSVSNLNNSDDNITKYKKSPSHNVHFEVLTSVSRLSWQVVENHLSFTETVKAFDDIKAIPHYKPWVVSLAVGLSCAGLCMFSKGDIFNVAIAFIAAFSGSMFRFYITGKKFNSMISFVLAAFLTTMITGLGTLLDIGSDPQAAMATAVLYLIPGIPLINSVVDLIEGYLSSAVNRALFAGFVLLCIATGMTLSITILGINNF